MFFVVVRISSAGWCDESSAVQLRAGPAAGLHGRLLAPGHREAGRTAAGRERQLLGAAVQPVVRRCASSCAARWGWRARTRACGGWAAAPCCWTTSGPRSASWGWTSARACCWRCGTRTSPGPRRSARSGMQRSPPLHCTVSLTSYENNFRIQGF